MSLKLAQLAGEPSKQGRQRAQFKKLSATWSPGATFCTAAAHGLDDAGAFVAEHDRQRHRVHLVTDDQVGVAQPGRDDADEDLVVSRRAEIRRLEVEGALRADDRGGDLTVASCACRVGGVHRYSKSVQATISAFGPSSVSNP